MGGWQVGRLHGYAISCVCVRVCPACNRYNFRHMLICMSRPAVPRSSISFLLPLRSFLCGFLHWAKKGFTSPRHSPFRFSPYFSHYVRNGYYALSRNFSSCIVCQLHGPTKKCNVYKEPRTQHVHSFRISFSSQLWLPYNIIKLNNLFYIHTNHV